MNAVVEAAIKKIVTSYEYSPAERALLKMLPINNSKGKIKTINSRELTLKYYNEKEQMPYYGQNFVNSTMRTLIHKAKANKENFKIMRSDPKIKPIEFWIVA